MYSFIWQENKSSPVIINNGNEGGYLTKEAALKEAKRAAPGYEVEVILYSEVSTDRSFRDSWMHDKTSSPQKLSVKRSLAIDISIARVRKNVSHEFVALDQEVWLLQIGGMSIKEAVSATDIERDKLKAATDQLKALDVNGDGIISIKEASGLLLPLELIA